MINNFKKRDIFYLWIIILSYLLVSFIISNTMYLYGSQLDWYAQHVPIAEYFRTLFYDTKDLLPDFAANIGSGQNIYNFSYYGLLSPIILISYLFPKVSMTNYIILSTSIMVELGSILLYIFLRNKKCSSEASLIATLSFILSAPIMVHSHRHIMFISYLPFVILGLFGVDKKLDKNKGWLLTLSVFLMIMTNYYYSIGGIACLVIYGIYKYLSNIKKVTFKQFMKTGFEFCLPILIGVLCSSIIIIPTFATLLYNRAESNTSINLLKLLIPKLNTDYIMGNSYGLGLTILGIAGLINIFHNRKKENIFIGTILSLFIIFPIFNFILNGTMYIDAKSLIPFLPLYCLLIAYFIDNVINKELNFKYLLICLIGIILLVMIGKNSISITFTEIGVLSLFIILYNKFNKKYIIIIPLMIMIFISGYSRSRTDNLVLKYTAKDNYNEVKDLINYTIDNDDTYYHISNDFDISETPNEIYNNIRYYNNTIYSSISNQSYNEFYFDTLTNNIPSRNRALTVTTPNVLSLSLMNNKYLISRNKPLQGYELVKTDDSGMSIYKNENVLPFGFATNKTMSYADFEKLSDQAKQEALLNVIVTDDLSNNDFVSSIQKVELNWDNIFKEYMKEDNGSYVFNVKDKLKMTYELPDEYKNKIIFIRFKMNKKQKCSEGDQIIKINNVKNKLTCSTWKYYNENEIFDYVLSEKDLTKLTITIQEGSYNISDIETYILDPVALDKINDNITPFNIEDMKGDYIKGNITVNEDSTMMLQIPYDDGFIIKVDNKVVEYDKVDNTYIGFKISKGTHNINIEYKAPYKDISIVISCIGIISFIIVTILDSKRKI